MCCVCVFLLVCAFLQKLLSGFQYINSDIVERERKQTSDSGWCMQGWGD